MAYVAITDKLVHQVKAILHRMQRAEMDPMADPTDILRKRLEAKEFDVELQLMVWGDDLDLQPRFSTRLKDAPFIVRVMRGLITVQREHTVPGCPLWAGLSKDNAYMRRVEATLEDGDKFDDIFQAYTDLHEANRRWAEVTKQVVNFLDSCKSANEAIKLWPDVRRYLPGETLNKLDAKTDKQSKQESEAAKVLAAMDMDAITASAVLARMGQNQKKEE